MEPKQRKTTTATTLPLVTTTRTGIVTIPGVRVDRVPVLLVGTAPLIVHKFSAKAQAQILAKHKGEASAGREAKDPEANFDAARHRLSDGGDGFPAGGIKASIVAGTGKDTGVASTKARGAFHIVPDDPATNLCRILSPNPAMMREDTVRNSSGVVDIRHRPEYWPWAILCTIEFLLQDAKLAQVLQAIQIGGYRVGLGEWRPGSKSSLSGQFGTYRLAEPAEAEAFEDGRLWGEPETPKRKKVA